MGLLYLEHGLTNKRLQEIVCHTAMDVMMHDHTDDGDISSLSDADRKRLNDNFKIGLNYLQSIKILKYKEELYLDKKYFYRVLVINEYRLQQLIGELKWLETYVEGISGENPPSCENMVFFERSTGAVIINGNSKTLKGTNKKLFEAMFLANPESVGRSTMLRLIGIKRRDQASDKIALNEAFSNLRRVCGVNAQTISLSQNGGKLNARAEKLTEADEIFLSNFYSD